MCKMFWNTNDYKKENDISSSQSNAQIANPFIAHESVDKAEETVGFSFDIPDETPKWTEEIVVKTMGIDMIEVIYSGGDNI